MNDKKHDTIDHLALTEALLDQQGLVPDVDAEWNRMAKHHAKDRSRNRRSYLLGVASGIAATFLLALAVSLFWWHVDTGQGPLVTYAALPSDHQVLWQSGDALPVSLTHDNDEPVLADLLVKQGDSLAATFVNLAKDSRLVQEEPELQVITTPPGCSINVTLPDSSVVWLTGNSRLAFPSYFAGDIRRVTLEGEAYFKAAHDAAHPLVVQTSTLNTHVLGTEFYVSAMADTNARVALVEGCVEVTDVQHNTLALLQPGQELQFDANMGVATVTDGDMTDYVCVRDGLFYFDGVELKEMMDELGRWYNVSVVFEDEELLHLKMRFFCRRHDSVEQAVSLLNNLRRIHAKVVENTVFIK